MSGPTFDLIQHLHRQRVFSERTFGPGARTTGVIDHIRKELREIEAAPTDIGEWIDVVLLALDGAWRSGASPEAIAAALLMKQTRNEARTWPDWRTADPNKAIEHDSSGEASAPEGGAVPDDVRRLVVAARNVAFGTPTQSELRALDIASEAFASRVPWDDDPEDLATREEAPVELLSDPQQLEAPAEAGEWITGDQLHEIMQSFTDRADVSEIASKINAAIALRAQPPAREDAQPMALPTDEGGCVTKRFVIFTKPGWAPEKKGGWLKDEHLIDFLRSVMLHDDWKPGFRATVLELTWDNDLWASSATEYLSMHDEAIGRAAPARHGRRPAHRMSASTRRRRR